MNSQDTSTPPGRRKLFHGWYIVGSGLIIQLLGAMLMHHALGAYALAMTRDLGWSRTALSGGFSLARFESGLLGPVQGWLIDKYGTRVIMRWGLVSFGLGFIAFSQISELWHFYVIFSFIAVGSSLGGFMTVTVAVVSWFDKQRARALSISQLGFSIGGLLGGSVILILITEIGWRAFSLGSGILILVLAFPLTAVMYSRPEDIGLTMDGIKPSAEESSDPSNIASADEPAFTWQEAMRTSAFWTIGLGHAFAVMVVSTLMLHLPLHLVDGQGLSEVHAAMVAAGMMACQIPGQAIAGSLGEKLGKRKLTTAAMIMHGIALLILAHFSSIAMIILFAAMNGLAWGIRGPLMQTMRAEYFGRTNFGMIMGWSSVLIMAGSFSGPMIAGRLFDIAGSYQSGFTLIALFPLVGSIFFAFSGPPKKKITVATNN